MILTCPQCATRYRVNGASFAPPGRQVRCAKCQHSWFQSPPAEEELALVDIEATDAPPVIKRPLPPPPAPTPVRAPEADVTPSIRRADAYVEQPPVQPEPAPVARPFPAPPPIEEAAPPVFRVPPQAPPSPVQGRVPPPYQPPQYQAPPRAPSRTMMRLGAMLIWVGVFALVGMIGASIILFRKDILAAWPPSRTLYSMFGFDTNVRGLEFVGVYPTLNEADPAKNKPRDVVIRGDIVNLTNEELELPRVRVGLRNKEEQEVYHWIFKVKTERVAANAKVPFVTQLMNPPLDATDIEVRFAKPDE